MRVFKPTRKTAGGATVEYKRWYLEFADHLERTRKLAGFTDRKQTAKLGERVEQLVICRKNREAPDKQLAEWLRSQTGTIRKALVKFELLDARSVAASKPLAKHLNDFEAALLAKGTTAAHAKLVTGRARRLVEECKFRNWGDLSASIVQRFLGKLRESKTDAAGNRKPGKSIQTVNFYLQAIKQFGKWMVRDGRAGESPIEHLQAQNVRTDRRHDRRSLSQAELV